MSNKKTAQSSFEVLTVVTLVFVGVAAIFSLYFQIRDNTLAIELAKMAVIEKLQSLEKAYFIKGIDFFESSEGKEITIRVAITPSDHGLKDENFSAVSSLIAEKIKYEKVIISPA